MCRFKEKLDTGSVPDWRISSLLDQARVNSGWFDNDWLPGLTSARAVLVDFTEDYQKKCTPGRALMNEADAIRDRCLNDPEFGLIVLNPKEGGQGAKDLVELLKNNRTNINKRQWEKFIEKAKSDEGARIKAEEAGRDELQRLLGDKTWAETKARKKIDLDLYLYPSVTTIPAAIGELEALATLSIQYCKNLESLPALPQALATLTVKYCDKLESLLALPQALQKLDIKKAELGSLPAFSEALNRSLRSRIARTSSRCRLSLRRSRRLSSRIPRT